MPEFELPARVPDFEYDLSALNTTVYRKFQHASLHNPIQNSKFSINKRRDNFKENHDPLFRAPTKYKLPTLRTTHRSKNNQPKPKPKQQTRFHDRIDKGDEDKIDFQSGKSTNRVIQSMTSTVRQSLSHSRVQLQKEILGKFKENMLGDTRYGQRDRYFNVFYNLVHQISRIVEENNEILPTLLADFELLTQNIDKNRSILATIKKLTSFKKNSLHLDFARPEVRIIFHFLLAELELYENNRQKAITNFELCEYYCRKQKHLEGLAMCFLWEIVNMNISLMKYEAADENVRNLLELAVVTRKKKAVQHLLEKLSLIYYHRGNSIMGQYYLTKSEVGFSSFQNQIFIREYSREDELMRLEHCLFNFPLQEVAIKRKNNPKFESDIWRQSKEEYHKQVCKYMVSLKMMLRDHEHAKLGNKIKSIVYNINNQGEVISKINALQIKKLRNSVAFDHQNPRQGLSLHREESSCTMYAGLAENWKIKKETAEAVEQNVTKVIKSHLSLNRENNVQNKEQRWKKFINFLLLLQTELKGLKEFKNENAPRLSSTQLKLGSKISETKLIL